MIAKNDKIGSEAYAGFVANNLTATENILAACRVDHIVHISSSVVNSQAVDFLLKPRRPRNDWCSLTAFPASSCARP